MGGMMALPDEGPVLALHLKNKKGGLIWVTVDFKTPDPSQSCEVTKSIEANGSEMFTCAQQSLTTDQDYPIYIKIYQDEGRAVLLESPQTKFRFGKSDAAGFEQLRKAMESGE